MKKPLVTAIVSTYNASRFMQGCLEDLLAQSIASEIEIIVIDSGSQQNEGEICATFAKTNNNIRYFRTEREGLYEAWNRAIGLAQGKYLTNANTDDRHRRDAFERLVSELENAPDVVLAYGDQLISKIENEKFDDCAKRQSNTFPLPDFSYCELMLGCITGSQPMWRKSAHNEHGLFDCKYRIAADYEFWLRISQTARFKRVAEPIGVFYRSRDTMSGSNNKWPCDLETLEIQLKYLEREPWRNEKALRKKLAQSMFLKGYHYVEIEQALQKASPFLFQAWKLDPLNLALARTFVFRGLFRRTWFLT